MRHVLHLCRDDELSFFSMSLVRCISVQVHQCPISSHWLHSSCYIQTMKGFALHHTTFVPHYTTLYHTTLEQGKRSCKIEAEMRASVFCKPVLWLTSFPCYGTHVALVRLVSTRALTCFVCVGCVALHWRTGVTVKAVEQGQDVL